MVQVERAHHRALRLMRQHQHRLVGIARGLAVAQSSTYPATGRSLFWPVLSLTHCSQHNRAAWTGTAGGRPLAVRAAHSLESLRRRMLDRDTIDGLRSITP